MNHFPDPSDREREAFLVVEDALHSLPLEQVPPRFTVNLMRQVGQASQPRFRLTWMDMALSLFAACMLGLVVVVAGTLPPFFDVYLRQEAYYWLQRMALEPQVPLLAAAMAALAVGGAFTAGLAVMQFRK